MEMRKNNVEEYVQGRQVVNKGFDKLKEFILETGSGVILINSKLNEKIFKKKSINNLFCFINEQNVKDVKYIQHDLNMFLIAEIKVKTISNEEFLIKLEQHYKLY